MTDDFMDRIAFSEEELIETMEAAKLRQARKNRVERDGRVCSCGHSAGGHLSNKFASGWVEGQKDVCSGSRVRCRCDKFEPVLESANVRKFQFATTGMGKEHALMKGVAAARQAGVELKWNDDVACARCKEQGRKMIPVPIRRESFSIARFESAELNPLLCDDCVKSILTPAPAKSAVSSAEEVTHD